MKKYKITIIETRTIRKKSASHWDKLGEEEVEREARFYKVGPDPSRSRITAKMGWTPETEKEVEESNTVFEQQVDELDLAAVIKTVNGC